MWRHFASSSQLGSVGELLSMCVKTTCNILGLKYLADHAAADCTDDRDQVYTRDKFSSFSIAQL